MCLTNSCFQIQRCSSKSTWPQCYSPLDDELPLYTAVEIQNMIKKTRLWIWHTTKIRNCTYEIFKQLQFQNKHTFQQNPYEHWQATSQLPLPATNSTAYSQPGAGHHLVQGRTEIIKEMRNSKAVNKIIYFHFSPPNVHPYNARNR